MKGFKKLEKGGEGQHQGKASHLQARCYPNQDRHGKQRQAIEFLAKVSVRFNFCAANIAYLRSAFASHFIAALDLVKSIATIRTFSHPSGSHCLLNLPSALSFAFLLNF